MDFFNKASEKLTKLGNDVSNKGKNIVEVSNLSGQVRTNEDKIKATMSELGKAFYQKNKDNPPADFADLFKTIKDAEDSIAELTHKIRTMKGNKICPGCNSEVPIGTAFCSNCGSKVEDPAPLIPTCPKCGKEVKESSSFCENCGEKLS